MPKRLTRLLLLAICAALASLSGCTFPADVNSPSLTTVDGFPGPPRSIAVADDFDGSGTPDVLVGFNAVDVMGLSLVKQDNYGYWNRTSPSGLAVGSSLLAVTDIDGNGTPDAITADPGTNLLNIMKNNGSGSFTSTAAWLPDGAQILKLASATDPAGARWIAVLYQWGATERFRLYRATGSSLTAIAEPAFHAYSFVGPTSTMLLANVLGDSAPDVILGENDGSVRVYMGNATNPAALLPSPAIVAGPSSNKVTALAVGDAVSPPSAGNWTRDGYNDLLVGFNNTGRISGFRGAGGSISTTAQPLVDPAFDSTAIPVSLSIDAATGAWAATYDRVFSVMRGTRTEIKTSLTPVFCDPTRATSLVPSSDGKPLGAMLCGDSNKLMVVGDRKRLAAPTSASFGTVNLGATSTQTVQTTATDFRKDDPTHTYSGAIGFDNLRILNDDTHQFSVSGGGGCPAINPTQPWASAFHFENCALSVSFAPSLPGTKSATLEIPSNSYRTAGATPQRVALTGTAVGSIASLPATMAFGNVRATSSSSAQLTITNTGNATMSINSITIDAPAGDWSIPSRTCGSSLTAGASCTATVRFAPAAIGLQSALLRLNGSQYGGDKFVALSGAGVSGAITGTPVDLGSVNYGDSASTSVTLTNDDSVARTISSIATLDSSEFSVTDASACVGVLLSSGQSCTATVSVSPSARGGRSTMLRVTSNASTATTDLSLTATGMQGELAPIDDPTDLGTLRVGFFKEVTVPLLNTGDAPLTIESIDVSDPLSVTFACSAPIAPGESCDLVLRFEPTAVGPISSLLQLHGDGVDATTEIELTGEALPNVDPAPPGATPQTSAPPTGRPGDEGAKLTLTKRRVAWRRDGRVATVKLTFTATGTAVNGAMLAVNLPRPLTYRSSAKRKPSRKVRVALKPLALGASRTIQLKLSSPRNARKLKRRIIVRLSGPSLSATTSRFVLK